MHIPITPIELTAGTVTEIEWLAPDRPHTSPDERGCPDCGQDAYDSGCPADGCNGWGCPDCGTGCDLDFVDAHDGGRCAAAIADEH
ncbi:hypothetical protein ACFZDG_18330 [Kitasatospora xanthocidica]|uniref:hypothetical protein n=1 Tax=Kitasatospora xanthocidica TaxID=83382 RepID=UPI0036F0A255